jgi:hypothetical protein
MPVSKIYEWTLLVVGILHDATNVAAAPARVPAKQKCLDVMKYKTGHAVKLCDNCTNCTPTTVFSCCV